MKLQIDTTAKTIKVDENVKFDELIKVLNKLLPKEWKSYTLESNSIMYWYNPITWIYTDPTPIRWEVTCGTTIGGYVPETTTAIYNVEVN